MQVLSTISEFRDRRAQLSGSLGLVPTMGYLHRGHLALVRRAREENDSLAVSIFVNPSQFAPNEDFAAYPREMERDLDLLRGEGVDLVFTPASEEIYPTGFDSWVQVAGMSRRLEGEVRPDHFRGVATVVAKLFNIVRPDRAYFGQKDGQQVAVVNRMAADLNMGLEIVAVPTVREPDGLALSSRNVYLTAEQLSAAPVIYRALCSARDLYEAGEMNAERLRSKVKDILDSEPLIEGIDFVSVADSTTLEELDTVAGPAMLSTAVRMGRARLIDNVLLG